MALICSGAEPVLVMRIDLGTAVCCRGTVPNDKIAGVMLTFCACNWFVIERPPTTRIITDKALGLRTFPIRIIPDVLENRLPDK